eukprot:scaffold2245_cov232-Pinguiococcus_pyrenoidosus.AAC.3
MGRDSASTLVGKSAAPTRIAQIVLDSLIQRDRRIAASDGHVSGHAPEVHPIPQGMGTVGGGEVLLAQHLDPQLQTLLLEGLLLLSHSPLLLVERLSKWRGNGHDIRGVRNLVQGRVSDVHEHVRRRVSRFAAGRSYCLWPSSVQPVPRNASRFRGLPAASSLQNHLLC